MVMWPFFPWANSICLSTGITPSTQHRLVSLHFSYMYERKYASLVKLNVIFGKIERIGSE